MIDKVTDEREIAGCEVPVLYGSVTEFCFNTGEDPGLALNVISGQHSPVVVNLDVRRLETHARIEVSLWEGGTLRLWSTRVLLMIQDSVCLSLHRAAKCPTNLVAKVDPNTMPITHRPSTSSQCPMKLTINVDSTVIPTLVPSHRSSTSRRIITIVIYSNCLRRAFQYSLQIL
jgi:hypothetical protein